MTDFETPATPRKTLPGVLWQKFLAWAEKTPARSLLLLAVEMLLIAAISSILLWPAGAWAIGVSMARLGNYAILKVSVVFYLVHNWKTVTKLVQTARWHGQTEVIEGIPKDELMLFIFETGAFKLQEAQKKFGISRRTHDRIARRLEDSGIFVRGKDNARVLNPEVTREHLAAILADAEDVEDIRSQPQIIHYGEPQNFHTREDLNRKLEAIFSVRKIRT